MKINKAEEYKLLREIQLNEKHKRNYVKVTVLLMLHLGESFGKKKRVMWSILLMAFTLNTTPKVLMLG